MDLQQAPELDFFVDPLPNLDGDARAAHEFLQLALDDEDEPIVDLVRTLGQHAAFATEILARQCRTFIFSISMCGSSTRLLRWDRSGCVVTESFDIREHPELLCEFLWRFSQASSAGRGHDPTVQLASNEEQSLFQSVISRAIRDQLELDDIGMGEALRQHYEPGRVYVVDVLRQGSSTSTHNVRRYLVSRPVISPLSFVGRGTRGYWAVDVATHAVTFLKDTWRFRAIKELEAETLQRLNDLKVRYVPFPAWYGDVCDLPGPALFPSGMCYSSCHHLRC